MATADERKTSRSLSGKKCALLHDDHADHVQSQKANEAAEVV
jgi:hypothetical protein